MSLIRGRRVPLALEDMAQVTTTVGAHNLDALHAESAIGVSCDGAGDAVKVRGPSAARLEFVVGLVDRRVAPRAGVDAVVGEELVVFAGVRGFSAFVAEDAELFYIVRLLVSF